MDVATKKKYNYWQWRTLIALMLGYVCYYFLRKNFSAAIPAMEESLGLSKVQLGSFLTLNGIVYGVSRLINGVLADRVNKRRMMTMGLLLSCVVNLLICFSPKFNGVMHLLDSEGKATVGLVYLIGSLWVVNGYLHGMGYPPCSSLMAHWFRPSELATKQSLWNASHSIGAGLVVALCGWLLSKYGYSAWNLCFVVPAAISFVGAIALYLSLRDTPSSVGLPEIEEVEKEERGEIECAEVQEERRMTNKEFKYFAGRMVFKNPILWMVALLNFSVYVVRFTILEWGTSFLTQYKGMDISLSANIVALSELIGGVFGAIVVGWATDHMFKNRVFRSGAISMLLATVFFVLFWRLPNDAHWIWSAVLIVCSAFFVYGVSGLCGIGASKYATKKAAASANGLVGVVAYVATIISGIGFGALADNPKLGWNAVFIVTIAVGIFGTIIQLVMWKAPADGYERVEKVYEEMKGLE